MEQLQNLSPNKPCHVVAIPYPGRGHINPMLNLCKLLVSNSNLITVTFVVTQEWLGFLSAEPAPPANIQFAALPQVIPSEIGRANDIEGFIKATLTKLEEPFELLLDQLNPLPATTIIYDTYLYWIVGVGNRRNVPVVSFFPMSASVFTFFYHFDLLRQHGHSPLDISVRGKEVVDYIPGLPSTTAADLTAVFEETGEILCHLILDAFPLVNNAQCQLFSSIYEIEEQVISNLKATMPIPVHHLGPMIPYNTLQSKNISIDQDYFRWLDAQPKDSVLYISLGSFLSVSSAQMSEIVEGIKESGIRFLWVTRGDTSLFKDVVGEKGVLVSWCDQLKVLCHPSVGGFWTHCGWNSTSEAIYSGVPMLTCPIVCDQIPNSKLIVNDLKIGRKVITNYPKSLVNLVTGKEIAQIVRNFMNPTSDERIGMVERATNLRDIFRQAISAEGSAASSLDAFVKTILS